MSTKDARSLLQKTKQKYVWLRVAETLLFSASISLGVICLHPLLPANFITIGLIAFLLGLGFFIFRCNVLRLFSVTEQRVARYVNQQYPVLRESADLILIEDADLSTIQLLQKHQSMLQFTTLYPTVITPHKIKPALVVFFLSLAAATASRYLESPEPQPQTITQGLSSQEEIANHLPATVEHLEVTITPPAYTRLPAQTTTRADLRVPQGSHLKWLLKFTHPVLAPCIHFSGKDSSSLSAEKGDRYQIQRKIDETGFYQLSWMNVDSTRKYSDYFQMEVINDAPPRITVEALNQFTTLQLDDNLTVPLRAALADDYGLSDAYIIATVSKGSGESVKFREERLRFDTPARITGSNLQVTRSLNLLKLGLEPGDELYFYIAAHDNKEPQPNRSRTETFFISLQDTASLATSVDPGLGVDLMPEYFRSQRQIIIDSEKLLRDKKNISKETFDSRSNALAYDQKILRLRYGEFLGEEFESGIGPQPENPGIGETADEDVTKKYGHVHDKENEHNLVAEKKPAATTHDHQPAGANEHDPVEDFVHQHDTDEEATFFTQSIRAKLKAAITIMWDAELYLRLYEPHKSLPFQYQALKLLKEISQDSRVYVHRTGFEAPPLKEEKRLTADLSEIKNTTDAYQTKGRELYVLIRVAVKQIDKLLATDELKISPEAKSIFTKAGQSLAFLAVEQPGRYLKTLSMLKALAQNELAFGDRKKALLEVRASLWRVLPIETNSPARKSNSEHFLDEHFLDHLEMIKMP